MNVRAIREHVAELLSEAGYEAHSIEPFSMANSIAFVVAAPDTVELHYTAGLHRLDLPVIAVVSQADPETAVIECDALMSTGAGTFLATVATWTTAGAPYRSLDLTTITGPTAEEIAESNTLTVTFTFLVLAE